jgi:hypothetical protein
MHGINYSDPSQLMSIADLPNIDDYPMCPEKIFRMLETYTLENN